MKQTFTILGMTCQNCRSNVEKKIAQIPSVSSVSVSLEKEVAILDASHEVENSDIEKVLGEKYTVKTTYDFKESVSAAKWKELRPLFLIISYLFAASFLISYKDDFINFVPYFMGLFYIVFSFFKFLDYTSFPASFRQYDPIAKRIPIYGWIYPFLETALGLSFLYQWQVKTSLIITLIVLGSTSLGVIAQLRKKTKIQCACLGTVLNLPMTEATLIENALMLFMTLGMLLGLI